MSKRKSIIQSDPSLIVQEILRIVNWWNGIAKDQFYEFIFQKTTWKVNEIDEVLNQLVSTGYLFWENGLLYVNKNMPDMTAQNYEGYRFAHSGSLFGNLDITNGVNVYRVDEHGNLVEIHEDPVGNDIIMTKDVWTRLYSEGKLDFICNICCENRVDHSQKQIYAVCKKCYEEFHYKPEVASKKDIITILHNWRKYSDKVTPHDIRLFEAIQNDISGDHSLYDIIMKDV